MHFLNLSLFLFICYLQCSSMPVYYCAYVCAMQTKLSHLDIVGRPVVVLEKTNVVPEHNQHFQVSLLPLFDVT